MNALELARLVGGGLLVLFVPGLCWTFLFFPQREGAKETRVGRAMDWPARLTLAFALSLALVPAALFTGDQFLEIPLTTPYIVAIIVALSATPLVVIFIKSRRRPAAD